MWWWLACVPLVVDVPPPVPSPAEEAAMVAPPPAAAVDPCDQPDGAVLCLRDRVEAEPDSCQGDGCLEHCLDHPTSAACAATAGTFRATCDVPKQEKGADGRACRAFAWQAPPEERPELLWRGCDANDGWSCLFLAELVEDGAPLPEKSRGDVAWLRDQACDLQVNYACAAHRW